jgi:hypothetical protein
MIYTSSNQLKFSGDHRIDTDIEILALNACRPQVGGELAKVPTLAPISGLIPPLDLPASFGQPANPSPRPQAQTRTESGAEAPGWHDSEVSGLGSQWTECQ